MSLTSLIFLLQASVAPGASTPNPLSAAVVPINSSQVTRGRDLASKNCQSCHAIGTRGTSPNPAAPKFRHLSRKYPIDSLAESFAEGAMVGHSVMPDFEFAPENVEALMAYLKSVQTPLPRRRKK
jgi:cytochrome c